MGDRWGLEAEVRRLRSAEFEMPRPIDSKHKGKGKAKGGSAGQVGKRAPSATGLYEPPEEESK